MAEQFTSPAAALWFVDPWHRAEHRWFDGARWTPHVTSRGTPGFDPLVAAPVAINWLCTKPVLAVALLGLSVSVSVLAIAAVDTVTSCA